MSLSDMKAFYRWLDESSKDELLVRRDALQVLLPDLKEENAIQEVRQFLRQIEQELLARVMK